MCFTQIKVNTNKKLLLIQKNSGTSSFARNKALLSDWFSAALQTNRKARRYVLIWH